MKPGRPAARRSSSLAVRKVYPGGGCRAAAAHRRLRSSARGDGWHWGIHGRRFTVVAMGTRRRGAGLGRGVRADAGTARGAGHASPCTTCESQRRRVRFSLPRRAGRQPRRAGISRRHLTKAGGRWGGRVGWSGRRAPGRLRRHRHLVKQRRRSGSSETPHSQRKMRRTPCFFRRSFGPSNVTRRVLMCRGRRRPGWVRAQTMASSSNMVVARGVRTEGGPGLPVAYAAARAAGPSRLDEGGLGEEKTGPARKGIPPRQTAGRPPGPA